MQFTGSYKYNFTTEDSGIAESLFDESGLKKSASVNGVRDTNEGKVASHNNERCPECGGEIKGGTKCGSRSTIFCSAGHHWRRGETFLREACGEPLKKEASIFSAKELREEGNKYLEERGMKEAMNPKDKKEVKDYNKELYPDDYAEDMVKDYDENDSKKKDTKNKKKGNKKEAMKKVAEIDDMSYEALNKVVKLAEDLLMNYVDTGDPDNSMFNNGMRDIEMARQTLEGLQAMNDFNDGADEFHSSLKLDLAQAKKEEDPCWDGYEQVGMKKKDGKEVPNCVPKNKKKAFNLNSLFSSKQKNPYYKG